MQYQQIYEDIKGIQEEGTSKQQILQERKKRYSTPQSTNPTVQTQNLQHQLQFLIQNLQCTFPVLQKLLEQSDSNHRQAISFFHAKTILLTNYLLLSNYLILLKLQPHSQQRIQFNLIFKMVEISKVLKKMSPMEKKIQYQVRKLMQIEKRQHFEVQQEPSLLRPKIEAIKERQKNKQQKLYRAPKYSSRLSKQDNLSKKKMIEQKRHHEFLKKKVFNNIQEQHQNMMEENNQIQRQKQKQRLQEESFRRLPLKKKDKKKREKLQKVYTFQKDGIKQSQVGSMKELEQIRKMLVYQKEMGLSGIDSGKVKGRMVNEGFDSGKVKRKISKKIKKGKRSKRKH